VVRSEQFQSSLRTTENARLALVGGISSTIVTLKRQRNRAAATESDRNMIPVDRVLTIDFFDISVSIEPGHATVWIHDFLSRALLGLRTYPGKMVPQIHAASWRLGGAGELACAAGFIA
jgi:hypothetical protein